MLVTASAPSSSAEDRVARRRECARASSLRSRTATSFSSRSVSSGSLGKRIASSSACGLSSARGGRTGGARRRRRARSGGSTAGPRRRSRRARRASRVSRLSSLASAFPSAARASSELVAVGATTSGRDHLVVQRRHDDLDAACLDDRLPSTRCCSGSANRGGVARRRVGELVHQLVDRPPRRGRRPRRRRRAAPSG